MKDKKNLPLKVKFQLLSLEHQNHKRTYIPLYFLEIHLCLQGGVGASKATQLPQTINQSILIPKMIQMNSLNTHQNTNQKYFFIFVHIYV